MVRINAIFAASLLCVGMLAGCASQDQSSEAAHNESIRPRQLDSVLVSKGSIIPTISTRADVAQQVSFVVTLPERGSFKGNVKVGQSVKAGSVIGWNNGHELKSGVDAKVFSVTPPSEDLPKNYAVIEFQYDGFGIIASAKPLIKNADTEQLKGKFQVVGGIGPTDCQQIVRATDDLTTGSDEIQDNPRTGGNQQSVSYQQVNTSSDDGEAKNPENKDEKTASQSPKASLDKVICIIGKDVEVAAGQQANLVIAGTQRENVLLLPVSAVAGRISKGKVVKIVDDKIQEVSVGLGVTDGARIEITDGLNEGDKISISPPDIDPRKQ